MRRQDDGVQFYDITSLASPVDLEMVRRLGYKRVFNIGTDIFYGEQRKPGIASDANSAGSGNVVGIIADVSMRKAQLAKIAGKEKLLIFNISKIFSSPRMYMPAEISKASRVMLEAKRMRVRVAIASLAEDREHMLSSRQMIACAMLLGLDEREAKQALTSISAIL